jgi:F0F1-type ATP synthase membrane subunit b/b'
LCADWLISGCDGGIQVQTERDLAAQIEEEAAGAVEELETELEACRLSAEREIEQARREAADAAGRATSSAARWLP